MSVQIEPFEPENATGEALADYHALRTVVAAVDTPEDPPPTFEAVVGALCERPIFGSHAYWAAYRDGRMAGFLKLALPTGTKAKVARVEVVVHPEVRRQGIGTSLLRFAEPLAREAGREVITGRLAHPDSAAAAWARRHAFEVTHRTVLRELLVKSTSPGLWAAPAPAGYRLAQWTGAVPEELLGPYTAARMALHDGPRGRTSDRRVIWTQESIREAERFLAAQGTEEWVTVAIHEASGSIVGTTAVLNPAYQREYGFINETSVVAAHRGHGLGLAMKAALTRWIAGERPGVERILTANAPENAPMIAINAALGYQPVRTLLWVEITLARLAEQFPPAADAAGGN